MKNTLKTLAVGGNILIKNLQEYTTKDLQEELNKREGITIYKVKPEENFEIHIEGKYPEGIVDSGPVVITVNRD